MPQCWICLGHSDTGDNPFTRFCPCSLVAHENCLLRWYRQNNKARCPQCQRPLVVYTRTSILVPLRWLVESTIRVTVRYGVLFVTSAGISSVCYSGLYALGYSIANAVCEGQIELYLPPASVSKNPALAFWSLMRRSLLIPAIPVILVLSRFRPSYSHDITLTLPMAAVTNWPPSPSQTCLILLACARELHCKLYLSVVEPVYARCADILEARGYSRADSGPGVWEFLLGNRPIGIARLQVVEEDGLDDHEDAEENAANTGEDVSEISVPMPIGSYWHQVYSVFATRDIARPRRPGSADWVLGARSTLVHIAYALALPFVSSYSVRVLTKSRVIGRLLQRVPVVGRSFIIGSIIVLLKDIINVYMAISRAVASGSQHVLTVGL